MVSERNIEQTLNNTNNGENQTEETIVDFSAAINAQIKDAMDKQFHHLQTMEKINVISSIMSLYVLPNTS